MRHHPVELFSHALPVSRAGKIIQFPVARLFIAVGFLIPVLILAKISDKVLHPLIPEDVFPYFWYFETIFFFFLFIWAFTMYCKYVEKRRVKEITGGKGSAETVMGFLISAFMVGIVVLILFFSGCFGVTGFIENKRQILDLFIKFFMGAFIEELLFRLIIFKLTEEWLGTWVALLIQFLIFGFAHALNDNSTLFTSLAVGIVGGLVLTAAYIYSRTLWFPLGIHWGWNFAQSGIFSMPNSGYPYEGWLITGVNGPEWLTGGKWGIEGSYIAILICVSVSVIFILLAMKAIQIVNPSWKSPNRPIAKSSNRPITQSPNL